MKQFRPRLPLLVVAATNVVWFTPLAHLPANDPSKAERVPPRSTICEGGEILGVRIGLTLAEAHAKLDPLRHPGSAEIRDKRRGERKPYWKLAGTEYAWIMAWANREGRIVQLSAELRPEQRKPFDEIGDVAKSRAEGEGAVAWEIQRPEKLSYRVVAKGPNRRATNIYIISTELERP